MPVPSSIEIRGPLLEIFKDDKPHTLLINELLELISEKVSVEFSEMSATEKTAFKNNTNDAIKYLLKNKLLRQPSKSTYLISKEGAEILAENSDFLDSDFWKNFETGKNISKAAVIIPEEKNEKNEKASEIEETQEIEEQKPEVESEEPEIESETENEAEDFPVDLEEPEPENSEAEETQELEPQIENEPEPSNGDDDIFLEDESETQENEIEAEVENENDDGIEIQDAEDFKDEEFENIPDVPDAEEIEIENETDFDTETENKNEVIEMNEPELELTPEAAGEIIENEEPQAGDEDEDEIETEEIEEDDSSRNSFDSSSSIEDLIRQYNEKLADDVIERLESLHQDNFCMIVMDLLSKMGYRVFQTARYTNEAEGSDLIQGIILENKPGMNPIYIQARKLSTSKNVSKADMLDFVNALSDKGGKGMFVTVGNFSKSAEDVASDEGIMLVDGRKLAGLMISNNFGVNTEKVFEIKSLDLETFNEYEE